MAVTMSIAEYQRTVNSIPYKNLQILHKCHIFEQGFHTIGPPSSNRWKLVSCLARPFNQQICRTYGSDGLQIEPALLQQNCCGLLRSCMTMQ